MPILHLNDVPPDLYERLQALAEAHHRKPEAEAVRLLEHGLLAESAGPSQAELLAELRHRSFLPPPGSPDSVELLREDRER